jgi:hypothetical protein
MSPCGTPLCRSRPMNTQPKRMDVQHASEDLRRRTLACMERPLDRLIYLASTRDYNSGIYYHDGLAAQFTEEVASEALADCHREAFQELLSAPLKDLVSQFESYMQSTPAHPTDFISTWKRIEPYRVAIPVNTDPLSADFLFSNFKIALAVLEARLQSHPKAERGAWPLPSLGQ